MNGEPSQTRLLTEADQAERSGRTPRLHSVLAHRGIMTLFDQGIVSLTNFSAGILIGRLCSKDELGLYMLGYSVVLFGLALQQMLISSPYILIWPRLSRDAGERYTIGAYSQQAIFGGLLALCLLMAAAVAFSLHSRLWLVLVSYALASPFMLFKEMFRRVCFTHLAVGTAVLADAGVGVLQLLLLGGLAYRHWLSAPTGVVATFIAASSLGFALVLHNRRLPRVEVGAAQSALQKNWSIGRWIFCSQLLWAGSLYSYPWLVSHFHGTASAGVWAACFGINALGNPIMLGLQNYVEPRISHAFADGSREHVRQLVWRSTAMLAGSMLLFSLLIFFLGSRAVVLLYGAKYASNGLIIFLITLSFAAGSAGFAFSCGLFATGMGKLDLRVSFVYPIAFVCLGIPLVARFGPLGGAMSLALTNAISTLLRGLQFIVAFKKLPETSAAHPQSEVLTPAFQIADEGVAWFARSCFAP